MTLGLLAAAAAFLSSASARPRSITQDIAAACLTENPYLIASCYRGILRSERSTGFEAKAPSIIRFNDTPDNLLHVQLASFEQVGAVWGLAYSARHHAVYAGAYLKRQLPFAAGGAGAIYRIDLDEGSIAVLATLKAGDSLGARGAAVAKTLDEPAHDLIGKYGLGDVDIDESEHSLFVTNLFDRRIYRLDAATGQVISSFNHGAADEAWAADARPFGLAVIGEVLYHAVVNTAESTQNAFDLAAYVYRSDIDGNDMRLVARVPLNGPRGSIHIGPIPATAEVTWKPWNDGYSRTRGGAFIYRMYPMPMATDLEIDHAGNLTLALRDRMTDITLQQTQYQPGGTNDESLAIGVGDLLHGTWNPATQMFDFDSANRVWHDDLAFMGDHSGLGSLAHINLDLPSGRFERMMMGALGVQARLNTETPREGAIYFTPDGAKVADLDGIGWQREELCAAEVSLKPAPLSAGPNADQSGDAGRNGAIRLAPTFFDNGAAIDRKTALKRSPDGAPDQPIIVRGPGTIGDLEVMCPGIASIPEPQPTASPTGQVNPSPTSPGGVDATSTAAPPVNPSATPGTGVTRGNTNDIFLPIARRE